MAQTQNTEQVRGVSTAAAVWTLVGVIAALFFTIGPLIKEAITVGQLTSPTSNDARVGTKVLLPSRDYVGRSVDPNQRTLLVFGGSCTGCSLNSVKPADVEKAPFEQIVFVYVGSEKQLVAQFGSKPNRALIIADKFDSIGESLGAKTAPRFYVLEGGELKDIWKDTDSKPEKWLGGDQ